MSGAAGPVSDITLSKCLLCGLSYHPYLGHVTAQVPAHQLCIKFAKGIKNKKFVIGKTRLEVIRYHYSESRDRAEAEQTQSRSRAEAEQRQSRGRAEAEQRQSRIRAKS